jgi:hypothetical protein
MHAHYFGVILCGAEVAQPTVSWEEVTCRECCERSSSKYARERLAELDRAQAQGGIWVDPSGKHHVEPPIALNDIPINSVRRFTFTPEPYAGSITINVDVPNPTGRPSTTRTVDASLLTRLSDFIASIPGNALDRKSNALAMQLRREIADVVCPADKVRG